MSRLTNGPKAGGAGRSANARPAVEQTPQRAASEVGVLMLDGWQVRQRGPGWGKRKTQQPRVAWHEWKTGVFYLQELAARKNGRGMLSDKSDPAGTRLFCHPRRTDEVSRRSERGWAIGSGPVASACLQRQGRFKRSGQFWTSRGQQHRCALIEARQNDHWDALWQQ